ncbi:hypothetical protein EDD16DRAFT_1827755 [Pisolithus croceorrhizus]|nr:hypothetical protein EDD16DRAFT_1827755 [Pisolithus croceorrhizus]
MLELFLKAAKLRGWLSRPECPPAVHECKAHALNSKTPSAVPHDLFKLIREQVAVQYARIRHTSIIYSRSSCHLGNSLIFFYPDGNRTKSPVPGTIKYIYSSNGAITFAVQRRLPLKLGGHDTFAAYPHFPAKLYSSLLSKRLEAIELPCVVSHFARWAISDDQVIVLSLCRD